MTLSAFAKIPSFSRAAMLAAACAVLISLAGCGIGSGDGTTTKVVTAIGAQAAITGKVHGGQNPITGATIQLWEAGGTYSGSTGAYGSAAKNILTTTVTSSDGSGSGGNSGNANNTLPAGNFTLSPSGTPLYTCDAPATGITSPYLYITAAGGNSGSGNNNPVITLVAALGACSALTTSTSVFVDEVTTVAAAYALAQFAAAPSGTALSGVTVANPGTSTVDAFGAPSTNLAGLVNAFNTAQVLASTTTGAANQVIPTPNLYGNTTTTTANVEFWQVNLVADILAACVNGNATLCTGAGSLTKLATPGTSTVAGDTLQAAVYMAQNPSGGSGAPAGYAYNLANLVPGTGTPFQPYSSIAVATSTSPITPTDLTIGITYTSPSFSQTSGIAPDSNGNIWVTNAGATPSVVEIDPVGNQIGSPVTSYKVGTAATTFGGNGGATNFQLGLAIDTSNNAWVADYTGSNIFEVPGSATLTPGSTTGSTNNGANVSSGTGAVGFVTGVAAAEPSQIAVDGANDVWFTQQAGTGGACGTAGSKQIGGFLAGAYGTYVSGIGTSSNPYGIAIDGGAGTYDETLGSTPIAGAPFIWSTNEAGGTSASPFSASINGHFGVLAMGFAGSGGTAGQGCQTPLQLISSVDTSSTVQTKLPVTTGTINATSDVFSWGANPYGVAIDSTGNVWIVNDNPVDVSGYVGNSVVKISPNLSSQTAPLTPAQAASGFTYQNFPASFSPSLNMSTSGVESLSTYAAGGLAADSKSGQGFNPRYIAIDGGGNAWISGFPNGTPYITPTFAVVALTNSGQALSPATTALNTNAGANTNPDQLGVGGFIGGIVNTSATPVASGSSYHRILQGGMGIAIDGSGNVWVTSDVSTVTVGSSQSITGGAVTEIVGSAVPVVTPLAVGIKKGTLATKP